MHRAPLHGDDVASPRVLLAAGDFRPAALMNPFALEGFDVGSRWICALKLCFYVNWVLFLLNLIPAFPFDGARAFRSLVLTAWPNMAPRRAIETTGRTARIVALLFLLAAVMMAVLVAAIAFGLMRFYEGWGFGWLFDGFGMALTLFVAGILGALLGAYVPAIKRWLAGENRMARRVHARAMRAFVEEEVFSTRERTGILLFVSMMEHRIEVLGDTGINQKVTADDWIDVVAHIRDGIRKNKLVDGLVEAIELCGALLERKDVEIRDDDSDELSNEVRFSDE